MWINWQPVKVSREYFEDSYFYREGIPHSMLNQEWESSDGIDITNNINNISQPESTYSSAEGCILFPWHWRCYPDPQHLWWQSFCSCRSRAMEQFNSLPPHLRDADLLYSRFRRSLKTFLFGQWGHNAVRLFQLRCLEIILLTFIVLPSGE